MTARPLADGPALGIRAVVDVTLTVGAREMPAQLYTFTGLEAGEEHLAIALGPRDLDAVPLVRVHSECLTGDVLGSRRCDCGPQLEEAMLQLADRGGYLLYLRQEGRGIGLYAKLDAYLLQDEGLDTFEANRALGHAEDAREYGVAGAMLLALGVVRVDLMTGNLAKVRGLRAAGVAVRAVSPTGFHVNGENVRYLAAKRARGFQFRGGSAAVT